MSEKTKNRILPFLMILILGGVFLCTQFQKPKEYSESERRVLSRKPVLSTESVLSGKYMEKYEEYALDQFPLRDAFRSLKAGVQYYVFQKKDNNNIYVADGHISKLEYPLNYKMLDYAVQKFEHVYDIYLKEKNIVPYMVMIPDKNYYLAKKNGYLSLDYDELFSYMKEKTSYMQHIEIADLLSIDDYYETDTHWKQQNIQDVAERIGASMGVTLHGEYEERAIEHDFYGVYYGQSALLREGETIHYLTNPTLENCKVTVFDSGTAQASSLYDLKKAEGKDPYEMFLGGAVAVINIENEAVKEDKNLVIFRDSFGSSLAPLLAESYRNITLVDIRYIQSDLVGEFVSFENCDVLFMYSTLLLNSSMGLK